MGKLEYPKVKKAIKGSKGVISTIAEKLEVEWHTADTFIRKHPKLAMLLNNEREGIVDRAESKLFEKVEAGDNWAIGRTLDGPGKRRGWTPQKDIKINDGKPIELIVKYDR